MNNDTQVRDNLAKERTHLANERTFLAYVRTALALIAGAAALLHFFPDHWSWQSLAWALLIGGAVTFSVGLYRFVSVKRRIARH